ncbi:MAG: hypothetical protein WC823_01320 [Parcubacteria group bacterium]|jgi:hypothetical protein
MSIKEHSSKIFVFVVNALIVTLIVFGIREASRNNFSTGSTTTETTAPVANDVAQLQADIVTDRENKLRDLNTAPKTVVQNAQTTTTVQPQATAPVAAKAPARKTKTS